MAMKPESSKAPLSGEQLARTLLFAKLAPPVLRGDVIGRARLLQPIERAVRAKLLLIHAPAGYVKTTLMVQWFKRLKGAGEGVGWINLDERDNDPVTLLASLQLALLPDSEQDALDALSVINRCAGNHERFTLFLDELEAVNASQALQLLELLVDYSPENLHVVVGTRTTPALPLARLRIRHELVELNTEHMRFLRAEAAQLLYVRGGGELSGGALDDLLEKEKAGPRPCSSQRLRSRAASIKTTSCSTCPVPESRSSSISQWTSWASCRTAFARFYWQRRGCVGSVLRFAMRSPDAATVPRCWGSWKLPTCSYSHWTKRASGIDITRCSPSFCSCNCAPRRRDKRPTSHAGRLIGAQTMD
jgi:hypothetical protein